jgi:subtilisin family serine protease
MFDYLQLGFSKPAFKTLSMKVYSVALLLFWIGSHCLMAQYRPGLSHSVWKGTAMPMKKGTELYFQNDTLAFVDLEGEEPTDYYKWWVHGDTLSILTLPELSIACSERETAWYKIFFSQNGEKLLLKPLSDKCMPRFTALVSQSPWYRKRDSETQRNDWHFLDPDKEGIAGAAIYSAYRLMKFRKAHPIVVAVMDTPADYEHEDLKGVLWKNEKEIPENQTDDDQNGFVDDVRGWFFNCSKAGEPVSDDQPEETRIYRAGRKKYENLSQPPTDKAELYEYKIFMRAKAKFETGKKRAHDFKRVFADSLRFAQALEKMLRQYQIKGDSALYHSGVPAEDTFSVSAGVVVRALYNPRYQAFHQFVRNMRTRFPLLRQSMSVLWKMEYNPDVNPREKVSENPGIFWEKGYGAGFLANPAAAESDHGTHVAGIIGARTGNGIGAEGISDQVRIMSLGVVPSRGDERDKDIANAIRYAADNGARIINMSFAKTFSPFKKSIDQAIEYAEKKGVLMIHAAGNSGENSDSVYHFPIEKYDNGKVCQTWLNVGNSSPHLDENLVAGTSNYGKKGVHLFAPGQEIFSSVPGNLYESFSGTSMAAPVVTGVAALVWSYFPSLNAAEIRDILIQSAYKPDLLVKKPGQKVRVPFSSLSVSEGIVNARSAVILAEQTERAKKKKGH